jgi:DNA-binding response OmpR family regulator
MATGARILVVDDDERILRSLSVFLRLEGHAVETARSFRDASALLAAGSFHLVITDVSMPEADGFELLKMVRNRYPETAVIMVTGYGTIEDGVRAIRQGAADYLAKPIHDEVIKVRIKHVLAEQFLTAEVQTLKDQIDKRYSLDNRPRDRRERHGQEHDRAGHPSPLQPAQRAVHRGGLRGAARDAARERTLRPRERVVYGGGRRQARQVQAGRRGHDIPGRNLDRHARPSGQAAARAPGI